MVVLFDIDGTLLNDKKAVYNAASEIFDMYKNIWETNFGDFLTSWEKSLEYYFPKYEEGQLSFMEQGVLRIQSVSASNIKSDLAEKIYMRYSEIYKDSVELFSDAEFCLKRLKEFRLGIISNGLMREQLHKLSKVNIRNKFEHIIISEEINIAKPDIRIFDFARLKFGIENKFIYIGDKYTTDGLGGLNAKMRTFWLNRNNEVVDNVSRDLLIINSLFQLPDKIFEFYTPK